MPCFHPLRAFRSSEVHEKSESTRSYSTLILGRRLLKAAGFDAALRSCIGCRSDKAQAMGQRCGHEQKMHEASCFYLTYDDEHVPADYSVKLRDWQLFLKRTRKRARSRSALRRRRESMASWV